MNNHRLSKLHTYTVIFLFIASLTFLIPVVRAQANNGKVPSMTLPNVSALAVSGGPILLPIVTYDPASREPELEGGTGLALSVRRQ